MPRLGSRVGERETPLRGQRAVDRYLVDVPVKLHQFISSFSEQLAKMQLWSLLVMISL